MRTWCLSGQIKPAPVKKVCMLLWVLDWHDHIHNWDLSREWAAASIGFLSAIILSLGQRYCGPRKQQRDLPTCVGCDIRCLESMSGSQACIQSCERHFVHTGLDCDREPQLFTFLVSLRHKCHVAIDLVQPSFGSLTVTFIELIFRSLVHSDSSTYLHPLLPPYSTRPLSQRISSSPAWL